VAERAASIVDAVDAVDRTSATMADVTRVNQTRGAAVDNPDFAFETMSQQLRWEQLALEESMRTLERTRLSHQQRYSRLETDSDFIGSD
jgi:hypothetical protein